MTKQKKKTQAKKSPEQLIDLFIQKSGCIYHTKHSICLDMSLHRFNPLTYNRWVYGSPGARVKYDGHLSKDELECVSKLSEAEAYEAIKNSSLVKGIIEAAFKQFSSRFPSYAKAQIKAIDKYEMAEKKLKEQVAKQKKLQAEQKKLAQAKSQSNQEFFQSLSDAQINMIKSLIKDE